MSLLTSEARISFADAAGLADRMIQHLATHEIAFEERDGMMVATLAIGTSALAVETGALTIRVESDDRGQLETLRSVIASHLVEFAGDHPLTIKWVGHEPTGDTFANFREVTLKSAVDLTPHMRRLTFTGDDIDRFASDDDLHVRMYFPPESLKTPEWPRPGPDGRTLWPKEDHRPATRYYTIRRIDLAAREIDVDFVTHDDAGPGSAFAVRAEPGAICGMAGPLGRCSQRAAWLLLAGDETALPAIARILETLAPTVAGHAFIEIADRSEQLQLEAPPGLAVTWLHRNGAAAGTTSLLLDAVRSVAWPDHDDVFAWAACEMNAIQGIRNHWRAERQLAREKHLTVAYWRLGRERD